MTIPMLYLTIDSIYGIVIPIIKANKKLIDKYNQIIHLFLFFLYNNETMIFTLYLLDYIIEKKLEILK